MSSANSDLISNDDDPTPQLSFAGCGFLCIYHAGVGAAIKEYAPQLARNRIKGASAGAIAAAGLICDVCISSATSTILQIVTEARAGSLQALSPNFNVIGMVRKGLEQSLPPNAHIICSGRLFISATRARDYKNVVLSEFDSREELIQAIICSCFIPFYCGLTPPSYRGEQYIDGGFSDNQPGKFEPGTITVSPFSGESDICPSDADSASLFGFDFYGTPIQFTTQNLFRMVVTLFPPSPEVCARICRQGFEDTLRFLTKNYMAPCVKCLTIQSDAIPMAKQQQNEVAANPQANWPQLQRNGRVHELKRLRAATVASGLNLRNECERCCQPLDRFAPPLFSDVPMPTVVQKSFAEMEAKNSTWLNYLRRWRIFRWWYRLLIPVILPCELFQFGMHKIRDWLHLAASSDQYRTTFQQVADFVLAEIEHRRLLYSPGLCPSGALSVGPISAFKIASSDGPSSSLLASPHPSLSAASDLSDRNVSRNELAQRKASVAPLDLAMSRAIEETKEGEDGGGPEEEEDSMQVLRNYCSRHDAILAFHYLDDATNQLKMCQIFDAHGRHPRREDEGQPVSSRTFFADEEAKDALGREREEERGTGAEDSGLSLAEEDAEEMGQRQQRKLSSASSSLRKDACCSPVFRHSSTNLSVSAPGANPLGARRHTFSSQQRPRSHIAPGASRIPAPVGRKPSTGSLYAPNPLREAERETAGKGATTAGERIQLMRRKQQLARPKASMNPRRKSSTSEGAEENEEMDRAKSSSSNTTSSRRQQQQQAAPMRGMMANR